MLVLKVASGAPLAATPSACTRLCTVPSRGMVTFIPGTLTRPAWAWLTKYMPYTDLKMKPNAARPTRKIAWLKVTRQPFNIKNDNAISITRQTFMPASLYRAANTKCK